MNEEELKKQIDALSARVGKIEKYPALPDHFHNGFDVSKIDQSSLASRKVWLHHTIYGTGAATAANYGVFFINEIGTCYVSKFYEMHQTAGTDAGAVTLMLEKLTGTQAPDAGADVLSTTLSLKATINTVQTGSLTNTLANKNLALGDRLCLEDAGTLTAVANVTVFVELTLT